jgi:hypothetical protein
LKLIAIVIAVEIVQVEIVIIVGAAHLKMFYLLHKLLLCVPLKVGIKLVANVLLKKNLVVT